MKQIPQGDSLQWQSMYEVINCNTTLVLYWGSMVFMQLITTVCIYYILHVMYELILEVPE